MFLLLAVLRSMVTATAFQMLVNNNAPIKAITDNSIVTLEVSVEPDWFVIGPWFWTVYLVMCFSGSTCWSRGGCTHNCHHCPLWFVWTGPSEWLINEHYIKTYPWVFFQSSAMLNCTVCVCICVVYNTVVVLWSWLRWQWGDHPVRVGTSLPEAL